MSGPVPHAADRGARIRLEGVRKQAIETGRDRLLVVAVVFVFAFLAVTARLVDITVLGSGGEPRLAQSTNDQPPVADRADVVDRNGMVLATSLPTASLYADPSAVMAAADTARRLVEALPGLDAAAIAAKLGADVRFVWLSRNLTPRQQYAVNRLGLPGLAFVGEARRVYPHGRTAAHVLGMTDVDGRGIAGVEHRFDRSLAAGEGPLRLSLDIRVQAVLREEVAHAVEAFEAAGAVGLILDVDTAEVLAMVSLPDFDPNRPESMLDDAGFNRATKGVYEVGSILKLFTAAMALDSGTVTLEGGYDASRPIRVARFTVSDFHGQNRWLSVPEIIVYSSNIGAARMGLDVGTERQRDYLQRFGMLSPAAIELPEVGAPLVPTTWREINTLTISYGHGLAISPLQLAAGVATLVNGGILRPPTLLARAAGDRPAGRRVISAVTSRMMRGLMRLVVERGTGRKANAAGYRVGGKTGTAEKLVDGRYVEDARLASFVAAFPIDAPRYVVLVMVDEPTGNEDTLGFATGGWIAAPVVGRVVELTAPILGVAPRVDAPRVDAPRVDDGIPAAAAERARRHARAAE